MSDEHELGRVSVFARRQCVAGNGHLYGRDGLAMLRDALADKGALVLWSAFRSPSFEKRLRAAGFTARSVTSRARADVGKKGALHTLFVARKDNSFRSDTRAASKAENADNPPKKARPRKSRPGRAR